MFSPETSTWKGRLRVPLLDRIHCSGFPDGADDGVRTRGLLLGKQACCHCTTSASRGDGPAGPPSAYSIPGARRLDMTSFPGMSALARGGMPHVVEPAGFEPATFPLRTGRPATGRRPRNAPDRIRTRDLPIRGRTLCPIELQGRASAHATACVPARAGKRIMALAWSRTRQKKVPVSHAIVPARGECTASRAGGVHAMSRFEPRAGHDPATFRLRGGRSAC